MTEGSDSALFERAACKGRNPAYWICPSSVWVEEWAKRVCFERCEVRPECLDYAARGGEEVGVWGGVGPNAIVHVSRSRTSETCQRYTPGCACGYCSTVVAVASGDDRNWNSAGARPYGDLRRRAHRPSG